MSDLKNILPEEIENEKDEESGRTTTVAFKVNSIEEGRLEQIRKWYRSPSTAHAIRLMIEDKSKEINEAVTNNL